MPRRIPTQSAVTIQLSTISTPAERLLSIKPGPVDHSICERAEEMGWTRIPVLTDDGDLAGLIPARKLRQLIDNNEPIDPAKATIDVPELPGTVPVLRLLDDLTSAHAVIHRAGPDEDRPDSWFALITTADLNRPLFRASIYTIIALLETGLGELIMEEFDDDWGAIRLLSDSTAARVREFHKEQKDEGLDLSPVVQLTLSDMFHIARTSRNVWRMLGAASPDALGDTARDINDIRNRVMHPIQPLIPHERDLVLVRDAVEQMVHLTEAIAKVSNDAETPSTTPTR